jgi:hypothetical protein
MTELDNRCQIWKKKVQNVIQIIFILSFFFVNLLLYAWPRGAAHKTRQQYCNVRKYNQNKKTKIHRTLSVIALLQQVPVIEWTSGWSMGWRCLGQ